MDLWGGDVRGFLTETIGWWMEDFGYDETARTLSFEAVFTTNPDYEYALAEDYTDRMYLELYPEPMGHIGIELREPMERLHALDHRLPSMFWHALGPALRKLGLEIWDHDAALEHELYGWWGEWVAERQAEIAEYAKEMGEEPEDDGIAMPSEQIPPYLRRSPVKERTVLRALAGLDRSSKDSGWADGLLRDALRLRRDVGRIPAGSQLLSKEEKLAYDDVMGHNPSILTWFYHGDALTHIWDDLGESLMQAGGPFCPAVVWPMPITTEGAAQLYAWVRDYMTAMLRASRILESFQHPDGLPLSKSLNRVEVRV